MCTSAPTARSALTQSRWPTHDASISAVRPFAMAVFTSAPAAWSATMQSACPPPRRHHERRVTVSIGDIRVCARGVQRRDAASVAALGGNHA
ncbi:hypothetical protein FOA52_015361 [Chlamydomonas sp. UWO 241]|nr:hypothetical protein FOA52_015361 [Chlamydomonas sp. UWO 241]